MSDVLQEERWEDLIEPRREQVSLILLGRCAAVVDALAAMERGWMDPVSAALHSEALGAVRALARSIFEMVDGGES